ncbi:MAG: S26 family signal peptidase [Acidimicrobiia bacterium]|nr:S26 family signal peptidase [Acidimicrobiia bacterium]
MDHPTPTEPPSPTRLGSRSRLGRARASHRQADRRATGERLRLEGSQVWIDGHLLAEPYAGASTYRGTFDVPESHYLLLGDNRDASSDSRAWREPYVERSEIVGVLLPRCRQ